MFSNALNPATPMPEEDLVEIFDEKGQLLCLMPPEAAVAQSLAFQNAQVLVHSQSKYLFSKTAAGLYGFTASGPVYFGETASEAAARLMLAKCGLTGALRKCGFMGASKKFPRQGTFLFTAAISGPMLAALEDDSFLSAEPQELRVLANGNLLAPQAISLLEFLGIF